MAKQYRVKVRLNDGSDFETVFDHKPNKEEVLKRARAARAPGVPTMEPARENLGAWDRFQNWLAEAGSSKRQYDEERAGLKEAGVGVTPDATDLAEVGMHLLVGQALASNPVGTAIALGGATLGGAVGGEGAERLGEEIAPGGGTVTRPVGELLGMVVGGGKGHRLTPERFRGRGPFDIKSRVELSPREAVQDVPLRGAFGVEGTAQRAPIELPAPPGSGVPGDPKLSLTEIAIIDQAISRLNEAKARDYVRRPTAAEVETAAGSAREEALQAAQAAVRAAEEGGVENPTIKVGDLEIQVDPEKVGGAAGGLLGEIIGHTGGAAAGMPVWARYLTGRKIGKALEPIGRRLGEVWKRRKGRAPNNVIPEPTDTAKAIEGRLPSAGGGTTTGPAGDLIANADPGLMAVIRQNFPNLSDAEVAQMAINLARNKRPRVPADTLPVGRGLTDEDNAIIDGIINKNKQTGAFGKPDAAGPSTDPKPDTANILEDAAEGRAGVAGSAMAEMFGRIQMQEGQGQGTLNPLDLFPTAVSPTGRNVLPVAEVGPKITRVPLASRGFKSWGYSPKDRILEVEFSDGRVYRYHSVNQNEIADIETSQSKGKAILDLIRGKPGTRAGGPGEVIPSEVPPQTEAPTEINPRAVLTSGRPGPPPTPPDQVEAKLRESVAANEAKGLGTGKPPEAAPTEAAPAEPAPAKDPKQIFIEAKNRGKRPDLDAETTASNEAAAREAAAIQTRQLEGTATKADADRLEELRRQARATDKMDQEPTARVGGKDVHVGDVLPDGRIVTDIDPESGIPTLRRPRGVAKSTPKGQAAPTAAKKSRTKYSIQPNRYGLFSQLERAVSDKRMQLKQKGEQWISALRDRSRGVTKEELYWSGVEDYLKINRRNTVHKKEILDMLRGFDVEEVVYGGSNARALDHPAIAHSVKILRDAGLEPRMPPADMGLEGGPPAFEVLNETVNFEAGEIITATELAMEGFPPRIINAADRVEAFMMEGGSAAPSFYAEKISKLEAELSKGIINQDKQKIDYLTGRIEELKAEKEMGDQIGLTPRYGEPDYQEPGGKNYREFVISVKLPQEVEHLKLTTQAQMNGYGVVGVDSDLTIRKRFPGRYGTLDEAKSAIMDLEKDPSNTMYASSTDPVKFEGGHYPEENAVLHFRTTDRVGPNGERVLAIEELQSDWAERGRTEGFRRNWTDAEKQEYSRLSETIREMEQQKGDAVWKVAQRGGTRSQVDEEAMSWEKKLEPLRKRKEELGSIRYGYGQDSVNAGPFVQNTNAWMDLAMKRIVHRAAQEGYDRVTFWPSDVHVKRYGTDLIRWERVPTRAAGGGGPSVKATHLKDVAKDSLNEYERILASGARYRDVTDARNNWVYSVIELVDQYVKEGLIDKARKNLKLIDDVEMNAYAAERVSALARRLSSLGKADQETPVWYLDTTHYLHHGSIESRLDSPIRESGAPVSGFEEVKSRIQTNVNSRMKADELARKVWKRMNAEPQGHMTPRREGFEKFYDEDFVPASMKRIAKKFGGEVSLEHVENTEHWIRGTDWRKASDEQLRQFLIRMDQDLGTPTSDITIERWRQAGREEMIDEILGEFAPIEYGNPAEWPEHFTRWGEDTFGGKSIIDHGEISAAFSRMLSRYEVPENYRVIGSELAESLGVSREINTGPGRMYPLVSGGKFSVDGEYVDMKVVLTNEGISLYTSVEETPMSTEWAHWRRPWTGPDEALDYRDVLPRIFNSPTEMAKFERVDAPNIKNSIKLAPDPGDKGLVGWSIRLTPEAREKITGEGFSRFKVGEGDGQALSLDQVKQYLPKQLRKSVREEANRFVIDTPRGEVAITPQGDIVVNWHALEAGHGPAGVEGVRGRTQRVVGSTTRIPNGVLVRVANEGVLPHEMAHVYLDHFATRSERAALYRALRKTARAEGRSVDEVFADGFSDWFKNDLQNEPKTMIHKAYRALYEFAMRIYDIIRPTVESEYRKIKRGDVFNRDPKKFPIEKASDPGSTPFKKWFGQSKVRNGTEPEVLYHGTDKDFTTFEGPIFMTNDQYVAGLYAERGGGSNQNIMPLYAKIENPLDMTGPVGHRLAGEIAKDLGWKVTWQPESASRGWWLEMDPGRYDVPGSVKNNAVDAVYYPEFVDALKSRGYDGIKYWDVGPGGAESPIWVAFDANQVKSTTGNIGSFSPRSSDIRYTAPETPEFKQWFGKSKIVTKKGNPQKVWHGTAEPEEFWEFKVAPGDLGIHFGTWAQAIDAGKSNKLTRVTRAARDIRKDMGRLEELKVYARDDAAKKDVQAKIDDLQRKYLAERSKIAEIDPEDASGVRMIDMYARIENPLRLDDMGDTWARDSWEYLDQYNGKGVFTRREMSRLGRLPEDERGPATVKLIKSKGFDGIKYRNTDEGSPYTTENWSYVVFDPSQLKSASENVGTFSRNVGDIRYSQRRGNYPTPWESSEGKVFEKTEAEFTKEYGNDIWSGSADSKTGAIWETHTRKQAEYADFHHNHYFSDPESITNGDAFFWFIDDGKLYTMGKGGQVDRAVARKVADELGVPLGDNVKYSVKKAAPSRTDNLPSTSTSTARVLDQQAKKGRRARVKGVLEKKQSMAPRLGEKAKNAKVVKKKGTIKPSDLKMDEWVPRAKLHPSFFGTTIPQYRNNKVVGAIKTRMEVTRYGNSLTRSSHEMQDVVLVMERDTTGTVWPHTFIVRDGKLFKDSNLGITAEQMKQYVSPIKDQIQILDDLEEYARLKKRFEKGILGRWEKYRWEGLSKKYGSDIDWRPTETIPEDYYTR